MITAYLGEYHPPEELQNIMVMDIGGTNVRAKMNGLSYEFHTVPDVILRGTAVACLSG